MLKKILLTVAAGLICGGLLYVISTPGSPGSEQSLAERTKQPSNGITYTIDEVKTHAVRNDCWTVVNSQVFDITSFIEHHPGGDEILRACGADGSSLFNNRTTDSGQSIGSGRSHSDSAASILKDLYIGDLKQ